MVSSSELHLFQRVYGKSKSAFYSSEKYFRKVHPSVETFKQKSLTTHQYRVSRWMYVAGSGKNR